MKILRLFLLGCFLLPFAIHAQDDIQGEIEIFGSTYDAAYVFNQDATGGTLTETEDGLYELQLTGIGTETQIIKVSPPGSIDYATENLASDWTNAIDNATDETVTQVLGELDINGDTVVIALYSASYDAETETITYTGEIVQFIPFAPNEAFNLSNATSGLDKADIPAEFGEASLTISASAAFWNSLQTGADFRTVDIRSGENAQCDEARDVLTDLNAQLDDVDAGDAATIATLSQQINYAESWIAANCNQ